jgi:hypothetical protein
VRVPAFCLHVNPHRPMLKELQAIQDKKQESLKAIDPLPKVPSLEEKSDIKQVPVMQHRIWEKWE